MMEQDNPATAMARTAGFRIAQGYLRSETAGARKFAVDYTIRVNVPSQPGRIKNIINVYIKPREGEVFGNGTYVLEDNAITLRLVRSGTSWHALI